MTVTPVTVKFAGVNAILPDLAAVNGRLVLLVGNVDLGTSALSLHENTVNYEVPALKKITVIGIFSFDGNLGRTCRFFGNPLADTTDGNDTNIQTVNSSAPAASMPAVLETPATMAVEIAAGDFINHISAGTGAGFFWCLILEEDV